MIVKVSMILSGTILKIMASSKKLSKTNNTESWSNTISAHIVKAFCLSEKTPYCRVSYCFLSMKKYQKYAHSRYIIAKSNTRFATCEAR